MKLSIVIPVFNERQFILQILERVQKAQVMGVEKEIIIVDDFSTDGTREILENISALKSYQDCRIKELAGFNGNMPIDNIRVIFQETNQGKGAALRRGFKEASGDLVIIQDADLEYDPDEYPVLIAPIQRGLADVVYGSRFLGGPHRVLFFWHYLGNRILTTLSNILTNLNLTDMEVCYKVFRREILQEIVIEENRFGFEPEITAKLAKKSLRIYEVPVSYHGRTYDQGKKINWRDGIRAIWCIIKYNLVR